jgi:uncharacterized protein
MNVDRRRFLKAGAGLGALGLTSLRTDGTEPKTGAASRSRQTVAGHGLPAGWRRMRKLDAHNHVFGGLHRPEADWSGVESLVEAAEVLGIERLFCSRPIVGGAQVEIEVVRQANDSVLAAMKRYPGRIAGYCFVQPGNGQPARDEIDRCLDAGMVGVKLYNQFKYTDPVVFPIAEKCIANRIPFLGHSAFLTDPRSLAAQPQTSHALDFCALSRRYPELMLILGHVNGGGDWEWAIKGLRECTNVFLDISGSVLEADTIERCVQELGVGRVLFATDSTLEGCVGKVLSAAITPAQREDIFWRNFQRILDRRRA